MCCKCCIVYRGSCILDTMQPPPEVWVKKQVTLKLNQFGGINLLTDGRSSVLPVYCSYAADPAGVCPDAKEVEMDRISRV